MACNAASFIGDIPAHYDRDLGPIIFADFAADIAQRAVLGNPARVLEIAAGTGIATRRLRDLMPAGAQLTATDLNVPMLEVAREKFQPAEQVEFRPADATSLPFRDGAFDSVVCQFGVMFFPARDTSYREVHRVLAPGGRYVFNVWDSRRYNAFGRIAYDIPCRFLPADPPQFYTVPFSCHRIDPIKESLIEAQFSGIEIAVVRLEKQVPDPMTFARGLVYGNPLADQIRARGGIEPARIVDAIAAALCREFADNPCRISLQAIVFSAIKPG